MPSGQHITQKRTHTKPHALHGVNLSGWLVLEPWVTPSLFAGTGAFDEASLANCINTEQLHDLLRYHRSTFIEAEDFKKIASRGYDAVRLQVPWFVFGESGPLPGPLPGCISYVDKAFDWAKDAGLKILIDVAVAPGADPSQPSNFFGDVATFRSTMVEVVSSLAARYVKSPIFLGIEPIDDVQGRYRKGLTFVDGIPPHSLRNFYREVYDAIREAAGEKPTIVFNDAGIPNEWRAFMAPSRYTNVWLDSHIYHYSDAMNAAGPSGVRKLVEDSIRYLERAQRSGLPVMVGEWSAALPLADAAMTPEGRIALERVYIAGQLSAFAGTAGWFYQTWKTEGRLSSWDARVALSSFEKGMFD